MLFITRPITVQAFRLGHGVPPDWFEARVATNAVTLHRNGDVVMVAFLHECGRAERVARGDWVVLDAGVLSGRRHEDFLARYAPVAGPSGK